MIEEGSAALRAGDAATARRAFESALAEVESGEVLEGLAEALYLDREYAASAAHYERAYAAYRRERQGMAAGRAARTVAWITGSILGDWAVQSGWWARAWLVARHQELLRTGPTGVRGHGRHGRSVTEAARVVVGADGRHSLMARAVQPEQYREKPPLLAAYYSYWSGLPMDGRLRRPPLRRRHGRLPGDP